METTIRISFVSDEHAYWTYVKAKKAVGDGEPDFSFTKGHDDSTDSDVVRIGSHGVYAWPDPIALLKGGMATTIIEALDNGLTLTVTSHETVDLPGGDTFVSMVVTARKDDTAFGNTSASEPLGSSDHAATTDEQSNAPTKNDLTVTWKSIVDSLLLEMPSRGSLLTNTIPVSDDGETLVIQLSKGSSFVQKMLQRPDVDSVVTHAIAQVFGSRRVEYVCEGSDQVIVPSHEEQGEPKSADTAQAPAPPTDRAQAPAAPLPPVPAPVRKPPAPPTNCAQTLAAPRPPVPAPVRTLGHAPAPVQKQAQTPAPAHASESTNGSRRLDMVAWEDAIKTMRGVWPNRFRFTRPVSDDGATVTIWVPKWSELYAESIDADESPYSARRTAEQALEKTVGPRDVVFWRADELRPNGCNASEPDPEADLDALPEQEKELERVIRPYLDHGYPADLTSLIFGTRKLDLSVGTGTRVVMFCIKEYGGTDGTEYRYVVQNKTNIILNIIQSVGLEIVSIDRTCTNIDKRHIMHHITIAYR